MSYPPPHQQFPQQSSPIYNNPTPAMPVNSQLSPRSASRPVARRRASAAPLIPQFQTSPPPLQNQQINRSISLSNVSTSTYPRQRRRSDSPSVSRTSTIPPKQTTTLQRQPSQSQPNPARVTAPPEPEVQMDSSGYIPPLPLIIGIVSLRFRCFR